MHGENTNGNGKKKRDLTAVWASVSDALGWLGLAMQLILSIPILGVLRVTEWLWENQAPRR